MSFINKSNHQLIQDRVASKEGVRCQGGGGHDYDADILKSSYGFTKSGAGLASELKGSYAPITPGVTRHNQCGGKKRRKRRRKSRRKNKSRKSRRKRRTKRKRRRRRSQKGGKCNYKKRKTRKFNRYKKRKGGAYSQFGSNEPNSPTYTFQPTKNMPWSLGPGNFKRTINKF